MTSIDTNGAIAPHAAFALRMHCRAVIEIMYGRLKDWRHVATRYDRRPKVFLTEIALAALVIYWV